MISYLSGRIIHKEEKSVILLTNGIGYNVFLGVNFLSKISNTDEIEVFTYLHRREDILNLYGFEKKDDLDFFNQLISVSGVGPKSAMHLIDSIGATDVQQAIVNNNIDTLTRAPGLGKKGAERIVVELKNKVSIKSNNRCGGDNTENEDVINALVGLGYSLGDSSQVVLSLSPDVSGVDNKIKEALKNLSKT